MLATMSLSANSARILLVRESSQRFVGARALAFVPTASSGWASLWQLRQGVSKLSLKRNCHATNG